MEEAGEGAEAPSVRACAAQLEREGLGGGSGGGTAVAAAARAARAATVPRRGARWNGCEPLRGAGRAAASWGGLPGIRVGFLPAGRELFENASSSGQHWQGRAGSWGGRRLPAESVVKEMQQFCTG